MFWLSLGHCTFCDGVAEYAQLLDLGEFIPGQIVAEVRLYPFIFWLDYKPLLDCVKDSVDISL